MKVERIELINNCLVKITAIGDVDGNPSHYDIELNKVIAYINNCEIFRFQDNTESGILRYTDLAQIIIERANHILYQEKFEYEI